MEQVQQSRPALLCMLCPWLLQVARFENVVQQGFKKHGHRGSCRLTIAQLGVLQTQLWLWQPGDKCFALHAEISEPGCE